MWDNLKASIASVVRTNNNQEITGANLQNVLNTIVNTIGANATFAGIAIPSTNPGTPDGPVFYIACEPGVYSNFNLTLVDGLYILENKTGSWVGTLINTGAAFEALIGYYNTVLNGASITVPDATTYRLTVGGDFKLKMLAPGTAATTLTIGNATNIPIWYNGAEVSAQNTWEANEIISVFYDGTRFMASNSQGGGGKALKIKYNNSQSGIASENVQDAIDEVVDDTEFEKQTAKLSFFSTYADINYPLLAGHKYRFDVSPKESHVPVLAIKDGDGDIVARYDTSETGNIIIYSANVDSVAIRSGSSDIVVTELSRCGAATENLYEKVDVIKSSILIDKNSCVMHKAIYADGTIQTSGVGDSYYISNFVEIPTGANKIVYSDVIAYSSALSFGCLYDSSQSPLYRFQGDGVIDLTNYPSARYVVIGFRTDLTGVNPVVEIQTVGAPKDELVADTRRDISAHNQDECTTVGAIQSNTGEINYNVTDQAYKVSGYIDVSGYDYCRYSLWNSALSFTAGAALYDETYNPVAVLSNDGIIEFSDYPNARYIVIAVHSNHKRVYAELGKGYRSVIKALAEEIPGIKKELMYDSGSGIQKTGNTDTSVASNNTYDATGVADSEAKHDGTVTSVSFCAQNTGTIHFMIGIWDETHEYFYARSTHNYSVTNTGNQTIGVSIPIRKGETLMVDMTSGVKIKLKVYSGGTAPTGSKSAIIFNDEGKYHKYSSIRTYLAWDIAWEFEQTIKEKVTENANNIEAVENECGRLGQQVSELTNSRLLVQGNDGKVYRLVVTDGVLGIENTTPQNILVLAHSFACILTGVWHRGMSSSKIATDWVSQMDTVFLPNTVNRVNMVAWEQAFPNPSSQLSSLNSYLTTSVDAIFIMCGANVPSAYRTQQYGQTNYAELVNYCKARATNAEIYVCSPGYTPETDGFNIGIKAGAESAGATYISTYSTQADKLANFGDVVWDASNNEYSFVINSNGRVNHPSDIWHLFMANNILSSLGYSTLDKYRSISCNASVSYRGHTRWVAGGHCTFCTFGNSQPTVSIVDVNNNPIGYEIMDLSNVIWDNTPPNIPKWAIHFDMPDSDVTISIS